MGNSNSKTFSFGRTEVATLSAADVRRLSTTNMLVINEGDHVYILAGTPIYGRDILDENGEQQSTKDGNIIRELSTLAIIERTDKSIIQSKITLSWLVGDDLFVEDKCPLLKCKDGIRKYAATWKLTKAVTRDFNLEFYHGMREFDRTLAFVGTGQIEGYKAPEFNQIFVADSGNHYVNVPELGDEISLTKVQRTGLSQCELEIPAKKLAKFQRLLQAAKDRIALEKK